MKKYIISSVLLTLSFIPVLAFAQSSDLINASNTPQCADISVDLHFGSIDSDINGNAVSILQNFLINNNYLNASSSGYFGYLTLHAVQAFQAANNIIPSAGYVGPLTRAAIKNITCSAITVTYPNGGETIPLGVKDVDFRTDWTSSNLIGNVDVYLRFYESTLCLIEQNIPISQGYATTTLKDNYQCPNQTGSIIPGQYKVLLDVPHTKASDESDDYFYYVSSTTPIITVTYPEEGFKLSNGLAKGDNTPETNPIATITWTSFNLDSSTIKIDLLDTSSSIVKTIATGLTNIGSYRWIYDPEIQRGNYKLLISGEGAASSTTGISGTFFIESGPVISSVSGTLSPGINNYVYGYALGSITSASLTPVGGGETSYLEFSPINATSLGLALPNSPALSAGNYFLVITTQNGTSTPFQVSVSEIPVPVTPVVHRGGRHTPTITITYPNGGEIIPLGVKDVDFLTEWSSSNITAGNVDVYVKLPDDSLCLIVQNVPISQGRATSSIGDNYQCPNQTGSITTPDQYKVSLDVPENPKLDDESNNYFYYISSTTPSIVVSSPNGGETLTQGTPYTITWGSYNGGGKNVDIFVSSSTNSESPTTIATNTPNTGSYDWTPTSLEIPASNYKVYIQFNDMSDPLCSTITGLCLDESDNYFIINASLTAKHSNIATALEALFSNSIKIIKFISSPFHYLAKLI